MKIKLLNFGGNRLALALAIIAICTTFASVMGWFIPYTYFKYLDGNREYIHVDLVKYNKRVYFPCEKFTSVTHYTSEINTRVDFSYQIYKVVGDHVEPLRGYKVNVKNIPIVKTEAKGRTITAESMIPCNFPTGVFFAEGLVSFEVHDEAKHSLYRGDLVTVESKETAAERIRKILPQ